MENKSKLHYWVARMTALDPGLVRLHFATNIVCSIFIACLVMFISLHLGLQTNIMPVMLTGLVALQANVIVNDSTEQARKVTTYLFPLSSALSITVATVSTLIGYHLADVILVLIVFLTFYLQQFGVRYFTLGLIGFLSFYFSLMYMDDVTFPQLLWYYAGILVAIASAYLVNFLLFKEQLGKRLKRSMSSFHIQANLVLSQMMESFRESKPSQMQSKRSIAILNEYARTVVSLFKIYDSSKVWPGIRMHELRHYLFDTTILMELLSIASGKIQAIEVYPTVKVRNILLQIAQSLKDVKVLEGEQNAPIENLKHAVDRLSKELAALKLLKVDNPAVEQGLHVLQSVEHSTKKVLDEIELIQQKHTYSEIKQYSEGKQDKASSKKKAMERKQGKVTLWPSTKKGLQAAVASAVAIVLGQLLSPSFPYWTVLAVNMVILGTETTGRTVTKSSERLMGTIGGAFVGVIAVQFVNGHPYVTGILLIISVFMAYYLMAVSYSIFIFWITMLLTMAFQLMNVPLIENVLILRVLDTFIGVSLGAIAASVIMPHRTIDKITNSVNGYIQDVKEFVEVYTNILIDTHDTHTLVNKALLLEHKLNLIKSEANSVEKWQRIMSREDICKTLHVLSVFNDYVKYLASLRNHKLKMNVKIVGALHAIEKNPKGNLDSVCQLLNVGVNQEANIWGMTSSGIDSDPVEKPPSQEF